MKRIAIATAAALLMLGTAQAQTVRSASPLYGELGYSFLEYNDSSMSNKLNPQALRGIIGYNIHPYFALEGMLGFGTSSDSSGETFQGTPVDISVKVQNTFGLFVKPKYDFNNFELFGRLGWARSKVKFTASVPGASASDTGSDSDFAYGVGVNYNFNPRTYVGVDYMRLFNKDDIKIDGVTVSVGYRF